MSVSAEGVAALLVMDDVITRDVNITEANSFTVLHFGYGCEKRRSSAGNPFGPDMPAYLNFTIKVASDATAKSLLERMQQAETFPYSFIFSTSSGQQAVTVANAYIVELEELYDNAPKADGEEEQMLIHAKLLLSNIVFAGTDGKEVKLTITND